MWPTQREQTIVVTVILSVIYTEIYSKPIIFYGTAVVLLSMVLAGSDYIQHLDNNNIGSDVIPITHLPLGNIYHDSETYYGFRYNIATCEKNILLTKTTKELCALLTHPLG